MWGKRTCPTRDTQSLTCHVRGSNPERSLARQADVPTTTLPRLSRDYTCGLLWATPVANQMLLLVIHGHNQYALVLSLLEPHPTIYFLSILLSNLTHGKQTFRCTGHYPLFRRVSVCQTMESPVNSSPTYPMFDIH